MSFEPIYVFCELFCRIPILNKRPDLSVIVPFFNEEDSALPMYEALRSALQSIMGTYELVFVDDGSTDETANILDEIAKNNDCVKFIKFRRNYGQTPAMAAGIDYAHGRVLVTMDGDLQNDPRDIPFFLEKINEGFDIVVGWRHQRQDKLLTRKIPSRIANWLIGRVTGVRIKDNGCSLKAYRAEIIKKVPLYSEMHRFIPAMASVTGARIAEIKVRHHARRFGQSKYGLSRTYKVLIDLLTIKTIVAFRSRPMLWFAFPAMPAAILGITFMATGGTGLAMGLTGWPLVLTGLGMLLMALAVFLILGGALAELIMKTSNPDVHRLSSLTAQCIARSNSFSASSSDDRQECMNGE